jgi:PAS domain-containing protein
VQKADEHELLERVREETERTFGISFSSLVRFISDHLLTRNERDLQALLRPAQKEYASDAPLHVPQPRMVVQGLKHFPALEQTVAPQTLLGTPSPVWGTRMAQLAQTSEAALARTEILGELSRLLQLYEQSTGDRTDGWFVIDLNGQCMYMNPAAEVFCGIRLVNTDATASNVTLEDIFAAVLPRVRNADEVSLYLRDFAVGALTENSPGEALPRGRHSFKDDTIRCVLAVELVNQGKPHQSRESDAKRAGFQKPQSLHASRSKEKDGFSTDHYYQLARYPLYRNGQLLARALRVHDITEQVRDEKNKSALLSSVSHDLRTPLTTIKAAVTGLLQPGVEWDEQTRQQILEEVDCETDHLTVLINALVEM